MLATGLWAGFLWGADGRLPLLISGLAGGVFAVALIAITLRRRSIPFLDGPPFRIRLTR